MSPLPQVRMSPSVLWRAGGLDGGRGSMDEHCGAGTLTSSPPDAGEAAVPAPGVGASGDRGSAVQACGAVVEAAGRRRPGLAPARQAIEQSVDGGTTRADRGT